jgi:hypothetical protein
VCWFINGEFVDWFMVEFMDVWMWWLVDGWMDGWMRWLIDGCVDVSTVWLTVWLMNVWVWIYWYIDEYLNVPVGSWIDAYVDVLIYWLMCGWVYEGPSVRQVCNRTTIFLTSVHLLFSHSFTNIILFKWVCFPLFIQLLIYQRYLFGVCVCVCVCIRSMGIMSKWSMASSVITSRSYRLRRSWWYH